MSSTLTIKSNSSSLVIGKKIGESNAIRKFLLSSLRSVSKFVYEEVLFISEEWRLTRGEKKEGVDRTPIFYTTLFRKNHLEPGRSPVTETN